MSRCIAILEDNADRRAAMESLAADTISTYPCRFFTSSAPMIAWLQEHVDDAVAISLDHDLEPEDTSNGWHDPGTGREVADFLATFPANCPVIIHSTNVMAARGMECELEGAGWSVERITPYDDLAWVGEAWLPALRNALVRHIPKRVAEQRSRSTNAGNS